MIESMAHSEQTDLYIKLLQALRDPDFHKPKRHHITEYAEKGIRYAHYAMTFFTKGEVSLFGIDNSFKASYNIYTSEYMSGEDGSTWYTTLASPPTEPMILWTGLPHLLPIWGGPDCDWRPTVVRPLERQNLVRVQFEETMIETTMGHVDIDLDTFSIKRLRFDATTFEVDK